MGSLGQFSPKMGMGNVHKNYRKHLAGASLTCKMLKLDCKKISVIIGSVRTAGGKMGSLGQFSTKMGMGNAHKNKRKQLNGASLTCRMLKLDCKKFLRS